MMSVETPSRVLKLAVEAEMERLRVKVGVSAALPANCHPGAITDEYYCHRQVAVAMSYMGFDVRSVRRHQHHPVWNVALRRGCVPKGRECNAAGVALKHFLSRQGADCAKEDLSPLVKGDYVIVSFLWNAGSPGSVSYSHGREAIFPAQLEVE